MPSKGTAGARGGVRDDYVDAAAPRERARPELARTPPLGEVRADEQDPLRRRVGARRLGGRAIAPVVRDEVGAASEQEPRRDASDAAGGAGQEDRAPRQVAAHPDPAVDRQKVPGGRRREVAEQEQRGVSDVVDRRDAAERGRRRRLPERARDVQPPLARAALGSREHRGGRDGAGRDGVDADPTAPEVERG